jgi:hypothetical protein
MAAIPGNDVLEDSDFNVHVSIEHSGLHSVRKFRP